MLLTSSYLVLIVVIPAQKTKDISRELQLQSELYELRSDYNKVLRDNEKLGRELEKVSKSRNENEMRLKYEFELEQLIQKNSALEKQLKKAKELRIRRESDDDDEPEKVKIVFLSVGISHNGIFCPLHLAFMLFAGSGLVGLSSFIAFQQLLSLATTTPVPRRSVLKIKSKPYTFVISVVCY